VAGSLFSRDSLAANDFLPQAFSTFAPHKRFPEKFPKGISVDWFELS
jgi:hypothetical protein